MSSQEEVFAIACMQRRKPQMQHRDRASAGMGPAVVHARARSRLSGQRGLQRVQVAGGRHARRREGRKEEPLSGTTDGGGPRLCLFPSDVTFLHSRRRELCVYECCNSQVRSGGH